MQNELKIFNNEEFGEIRTVTIENEPYFVGKDIAITLGYSNASKAVSVHIDDEDKQFVMLDITDSQNGNVPIGQSKTTVINESGLYSLILSSKLPSAKKFKRWVTSAVLPSLRKTGSYKMPKNKKKSERLASVNNAVKILTPMLKAAGCNSQIQLLTAKSLYEKAGVVIPIEIKADQKYFDSVHIARQVGILFKSSGNPADKAVIEIIRRLNLPKSEYTETWEAKGNWQGPVRKYAETTIDKVKAWMSEHNYPNEIEYTQYDGQVKRYHVVYRSLGVA